MTFQITWGSFWCGVAGGCLGYYATHWIDRRIAGWRYRRNTRWFEAQTKAHPNHVAAKPSAWPRVDSNTARRPNLGIHTGFDDGD